MMVLRGNTFCVALFSGIWGLERLTLTLFNLCVANFLTTIAQSTRVAMMGTIYIVVQVSNPVLLTILTYCNVMKICAFLNCLSRIITVYLIMI